MKPYHVVDAQTGLVMGRYASLRRASRRAVKLDMEYGAVRYVVKFVQTTQE